ncbi:MAG: KH domain-containing protein, partial [Candidatus Aenigmarchaeota archaeon]|nr:KH domain-containing protein [Candidatus Aenigmarchaeota archaeon]
MEKLCSFCRNGELLCQSCKKKLEEGRLSQLDVDVARALNPLEAVKIVDAGKVLVMVKPADARAIIGRGGSGVRALEEKLGRKVKIVEQSEDKKKLAEDVLRLRVIGVNVLYDKV